MIDTKGKTYIILETRTKGELEMDVNELMKEGWIPVGNVTVKIENAWYVQALVKLKKTRYELIQGEE